MGAAPPQGQAGIYGCTSEAHKSDFLQPISNS
jgi:hypothetical protein